MYAMTTQNIKYMIRWKKSVRLIWIFNIESVKADGNYSIVFLKDGSFIRNEKPIKEVFENLYKFNFLRIHKSFIININQCNELDLNSNRQAIMDSGTSIPVSRSRAREILSNCKRGQLELV